MIARGKKATAEHRRNISESLKGKRPKNLDTLHAQQRGSKRPEMQGEQNGNWKGAEAGYGAIHTWIRRQFGPPLVCEQCGTTSAGRYEWHNLSGKYRRGRDDWQGLCTSCHRKVSFAATPDYEPWNKGTHLQLNTGRTHIQPGQHLSPATEFVPGQKPWNAHLEPRPCLTCGESFQPREADRKYCSYRCYWGRNKK